MSQPRSTILLVLAAVLSCAAPLAAQRDPVLTLTRIDAKPGTKWDGRQALALRVDVLHPGMVHDVVSKAVVLAPQVGVWADSVSIQVDGGPKDLTWAWKRSAPGDAAVTLSTFDHLSLGFTLSPKERREIPPGRYAFRAIMSIASGGEWQGKAISEPLALEVAGPEETVALLTLSLPVPELSPFDPWVLTIAAEAAGNRDLRGLQFEVLDPDGKPLDWSFDVALVVNRADAPLRRPQPLLLLAAREAKQDSAPRPGEYTVRATWPRSDSWPVARGSLRVRVTPAVVGAERMQPACASALANALLSRAESSPSRDIPQLVARAAALLVPLEAEALRSLRSAPTAFERRLALAEILTLERRYDEAGAWLELAIEGMPGLDASKATSDELAARLRVRDLHAEVRARKEHNPTRLAHEFANALTLERGRTSPHPWAVSARASSEYGADRWGAIQAVGRPSVTKPGDSALSWAPKNADAGEEWLEVTFAEARSASAIRIVQNLGPGAIVNVESLDGSGKRIPIWKGPDRTVYPPQQIGILVVPVPPQHPPIRTLRITLDTALVKGWNEIDAVQLMTAER